MAGTFQATLSGKFTPLVNLRDDNTRINNMITSYNTALINTAIEVLGMVQRRKKAWVALYLCDEGRNLKERRYYKRVQKALQKAKEDWTDTQCKELVLV